MPPRPKVPDILKAIVSPASARDWVRQQAAHIQRCEVVMRAAKSLCEYRAKASRRYELFDTEQRRQRKQIERRSSDADALPQLAYRTIEQFDAGAWVAEIIKEAPSSGRCIELVTLDPRERFGAISAAVPIDFGIAYTRRRRPGDHGPVMRVRPSDYGAFRTIQATLGSIYHSKANRVHAATALAVVTSQAMKEPLPSGIELAVIAVASEIDVPLVNATEDSLAHRGSAWAKRKRSRGALSELKVLRDSAIAGLLTRSRGNPSVRKKRQRQRRRSSNS